MHRAEVRPICSWQPRLAAYSRRARFCIASRLLIIRRDTGRQPGPEHFRPPPCLAENVFGFWLLRSPFRGRFRMSPNHGRRGSFSAGQD